MKWDVYLDFQLVMEGSCLALVTPSTLIVALLFASLNKVVETVAKR